MMHIRKLLSRKFNIVCLNLAGLLTCFMMSHLPILKRTVVLKKTTSLNGCQIKPVCRQVDLA